MLRAKTLFRSFSLTWCTICFSIIISNILETLGRKINLFCGLYLIGLMLAKFEFCKKNYFSNISEFHLSAKFQSSEDSFRLLLRYFQTYQIFEASTLKFHFQYQFKLFLNFINLSILLSLCHIVTFLWVHCLLSLLISTIPV